MILEVGALAGSNAQPAHDFLGRNHNERTEAQIIVRTDGVTFGLHGLQIVKSTPQLRQTVVTTQAYPDKLDGLAYKDY
jgi:hypothetical protein